MKDYISANSKNVFAKAIGLGWVSRLSTLSVSRPQPADWHSHESIEILVCHRGALQYEFKTFPPATLRPGCFLVVQPNLPHRLHDGLDGQGSRSSIFLKPPGRSFRVRDFFSTDECRDTIALLLAKRLQPGRLSSNKERDLMRLSALIAKGTAMNDLERLELRALVVSSVISIAGTRRNGEDKTGANIVDEAIAWIDARLGQKFSLDDLVAYIGYGRSRFFTLFKEQTGLPPLEWTTRRRLEKAKRLLAVEHLSVAETARAVGFNSPVFFSKTFRAHQGLSPTSWVRNATPDSFSFCRHSLKQPASHDAV